MGWMRWLVLVSCVLACNGRREFVTTDADTGGVDAGTDAPGIDAPGFDAPPPDVPGVDAPLPDVPGVDAFDSGTDAGPTGLYLDRCVDATDCVSSLCVLDTDGTRFCSRSCSAHSNCADEHVCAEGVCGPDDTGAACSTASPASCNLGLCIGISGGAGHCTRQCASANECPAGFACTRAGGMKICAEIEKPCTATGTECVTGLCDPTLGCTSTCDSAADCPRRGTAFGVTPYTCEFNAGAGGNVCIPPIDIMGADRMGTFCNPAVNSCRSGLCADLNETDAIPDQCVQVCNPEGGCPDGFGCQPQVTVEAGIQPFCVPSGAGALEATCGGGADCASALCDDPGAYCTRLCVDGFCPSGWTCSPIPGSSVSICRQP